MSELEWNWLAVPYLACVAALVALLLVVALLRGDRVMRMGMLGAAISALPWAVCSAMACCTTDPEIATRVFRLGNAPVAFIGPNLMLVLLGVSGQLERIAGCRASPASSGWWGWACAGEPRGSSRTCTS